MPKQRIVNANCPFCKAENSIVIRESINIATDPKGGDIKSAILSDVMYGYLCNNCHRWVNIIYPSLYKDPSKKLLVWLVPGYDNRILEAISKINPENGFKARIVSEPESLREKILLAEEGLNDQIIEYLKYKKYLFFSEYDDFLRDSVVDKEVYEKESSKVRVFVYYLLSKNGKKILRVNFNINDYNIAKKEFHLLFNNDYTNDNHFKVIDYRWAERLLSHVDYCQTIQ